MRKIITFYLLVCCIIFLLIFSSFLLTKKTDTQKDNTFYLYNWGEYLDPSLLDKFSQQYDYNVIYETYDSNEAMYLKIKNNAAAYDLIIPSEYMIKRMIDENLLLNLDHSKINNLAYIDENFLDVPTDPNNNYSIPYFWGTVGIIYNPNLTDLTFTSWTDLWNNSLENNIFLIDSARETLGFSLNSLGYSLNTTDPEIINLATDNLLTLNNNIKGVVGDEALELIPQGEVAAALTWSGSAKDMQAANEELIYVIPKEGTNIWLDSMVIPQTSSNQQAAYDFINFMLKPANAAQNAEYVGYATPNLLAKEALSSDDTTNLNFYPSDFTNLEYYEHLSDKSTQLYNQKFLEFKMQLH